MLGNITFLFLINTIFVLKTLTHEFKLIFIKYYRKVLRSKYYRKIRPFFG